MKAIFLGLIGVGLCIHASADRSADNNLFTMDGVAYKDITSLRVEPDGLVIEYYPPSCGIGMAKVKFTRLTPELQKRFGYDAAKARDFEAKIAKANEDARQDSIRWEENAKTARAAQQVREAEAEKNATDRILAMAQLKQAEADLVRATGGEGGGGGGNYNYLYSDGGYGGYGSGFFGNGGFGNGFVGNGFFGSGFSGNGFFGNGFITGDLSGQRLGVNNLLPQPPWNPLFPGIDAVHSIGPSRTTVAPVFENPFLFQNRFPRTFQSSVVR